MTIHYASIDAQTTVFLEQCQNAVQALDTYCTIPLDHGYRTENSTRLSRLALVTVITTELSSFNLHATDLTQTIDRRCSSTGNFIVAYPEGMNQMQIGIKT